MIIVEGSDKLGKTTFCGLLKQALEEEIAVEAEVLHMSRPKEDFDFFRGYTSQIKFGTIRDRFHLGEFCYELANSRTPRYSKTSLMLLSSWLRAAGCVTVIFVAKDDEWYKEILKKNPDDKFSDDVLLRANAYYTSLYYDNVNRELGMANFLIDSSAGYPDINKAVEVVRYYMNVYKVLKESLQ